MGATIPFSIQVNDGQPPKEVGRGVIPQDADEMEIIVDTTWLPDPTATIAWGLERSADGGNTWIDMGKGSRNGGSGTTPKGVNLDQIEIKSTVDKIRGQIVRGFLSYVTGNTGTPNHANAAGQLKLLP